MTSWANLAADAAELSGAPIDEARLRAAFAGADEEWKRSAALSLGAAAGQRAAEAAVVLATITLRLAADPMGQPAGTPVVSESRTRGSSSLRRFAGNS